MNKATADALCAKVTGEEDSLALAYGRANSRELRGYVKVRGVFLCHSIVSSDLHKYRYCTIKTTLDII